MEDGFYDSLVDELGRLRNLLEKQESFGLMSDYLGGASKANDGFDDFSRYLSESVVEKLTPTHDLLIITNNQIKHSLDTLDSVLFTSNVVLSDLSEGIKREIGKKTGDVTSYGLPNGTQIVKNLNLVLSQSTDVDNDELQFGAIIYAPSNEFNELIAFEITGDYEIELDAVVSTNFSEKGTFSLWDSNDSEFVYLTSDRPILLLKALEAVFKNDKYRDEIEKRL